MILLTGVKTFPTASRYVLFQLVSTLLDYSRIFSLFNYTQCFLLYYTTCSTRYDLCVSMYPGHFLYTTCLPLYFSFLGKPKPNILESITHEEINSDSWFWNPITFCLKTQNIDAHWDPGERRIPSGEYITTFNNIQNVIKPMFPICQAFP